MTPASDSRAPNDLAGQRVSVIGLGRFGGGLGVTRWLVEQGAKVTVSDQASEEDLAASLDPLRGLDVTLHLGGHREEDFTQADLLVVNPAVPKTAPLLQQAIRAGVPRTTEINLFLERCPCPVVGITGSVGKSTTTAMTGLLLGKLTTTHVGGNIGRSLLGELESIDPDHLAVLELSSFQLEDLPLVELSPHVGLVTNLQPNHLDRHGSMAAYASAKKNIFRYQSAEDVLVLPTQLRDWSAEAKGRVLILDPDEDGFTLSVPGDHNQRNAHAAWAIARELGLSREQAEAALREFTGLPHRLELVADKAGVRYYNDSKCTTPGGAIVAIQAFPARRSIVILGGYDKGVSFDELGEVAAGAAKAVIVLGDTREQIAQAVESHRQGELPQIHGADTLAQAVTAASRAAAPGDVVLLSPACASYDMFTNYEQRGEQFVQIVRDL